MAPMLNSPPLRCPVPGVALRHVLPLSAALAARAGDAPYVK